LAYLSIIGKKFDYKHNKEEDWRQATYDLRNMQMKKQAMHKW